MPQVRAWLTSLQPRPSEVIEPFAGGGIIGLSALFDGLCERLTLVELDSNVAAVWQTILEGGHERLADQILTFEVTEQNVRESLSRECNSVPERAFATILRNRMQRGGIMAPGASLMKKGENGHGLKSRWYPETLARRIMAIADRRESIRFIEGDGLRIIEANSQRTDVAFFIDPPYTVAGRRLYIHSDIDHKDLFEQLSRVAGHFLITYDDAPEIRTLAGQHGFNLSKVAMKNTHHEIMYELLIEKASERPASSDESLHLVQDSLFEGLLIDGLSGS